MTVVYNNPVILQCGTTSNTFVYSNPDSTFIVTDINKSLFIHFYTAVTLQVVFAWMYLFIALFLLPTKVDIVYKKKIVYRVIYLLYTFFFLIHNMNFCRYIIKICHIRINSLIRI